LEGVLHSSLKSLWQRVTLCNFFSPWTWS